MTEKHDERSRWQREQYWKRECWCIKHRRQYQGNIVHTMFTDMTTAYFHVYNCAACEVEFINNIEIPREPVQVLA